MSGAEAKVWKRLKSKQLGVKFRRQHTIHNYIVDFYSPKAKLVVEVDGSEHDPVADAARDAELHKLGLIVYRISTEDVHNPEVFRHRIDHICRMIEERA